MKLILLAAVVVIFVTPGLLLGQSAKPNNALEQEIRKLDIAEADGLLHKDVAVLEKLWAEDFTVNNPRNGISHGRKEVVALIRNGIIDYFLSFERLRLCYFTETPLLLWDWRQSNQSVMLPLRDKPCGDASRISG